MLESAEFRLLINHDDDKRENTYTSGAERIFALARENDYTI